MEACGKDDHEANRRLIEGIVPTETSSPDYTDGDEDDGGSDNVSDVGSGLSAGAIAGIAIGSAAFMALVTGAVAFFFFRRLRDQLLHRTSPEPPPPGPSSTVADAQKPAPPSPAVAPQKTPSPSPTSGSRASPPPAAAADRGTVPGSDSVVEGSMGGATAVDLGSPAVPAVQGVAASGPAKNQGDEVAEVRGREILEAPGYVPYEMAANEPVGGRK